MLDADHPELKWFYECPDTLVPVVEASECFEIAVIGGMPAEGHTFTVSTGL
jgi:hypothetical protein